MPEKQNFFEETQDLVESYASNRLRLLKLQTAEKSSRVITVLLAGIVISLLSFFILLFVSIMAGYFFSEKLHSQFYGFGIVTLMYVLLLVVALLLRKRLDKFIFEKLITILFESNNDDNDNPQ